MLPEVNITLSVEIMANIYCDVYINDSVNELPCNRTVEVSK